MSAVHAVLKQPGKKYNPLVLTGKSGLGKTHLLNAIGTRAGEGAAGRRGVPVHAGVHRRGSSPRSTATAWIGGARGTARCTALLLDDIHLLAGRIARRKSCSTLFNLLHDGERQLVFTAPAHPSTLEGVEERIGSRLEGGLVVELTEPDRDVRRDVLDRVFEQQQAIPDSALLDYLADRPVDSVRSLIGLVQRVMSAAVSAGPAAHCGARRARCWRASRSRPSAPRAASAPAVSSCRVWAASAAAKRWRGTGPIPADRMIEDLR